MASRAERPSRREVALAIPCLPFLGPSGSRLDLSRREEGSAVDGYSSAILVRHAEKDPASDPKDPTLSPAGKERARALQRLLARAGATHLFASQYRRTRETLTPLAEARSLEIEALPAADLSGLVARLQALPAGSVAVLAGHSNTVPAIASALGGTMKDLVSTTSGPALPDDEYTRIVVVTWPVVAGAASPEGESTGKPRASSIEFVYGA